MAVALLVATAAALAPPYLAGRAIDSGIVAGDEDALTVIVVIFIASVAIYWAASYAQTYLVGWVGQRALQDLRERIYRHIQRMSIGFFTRRRPGVLISRMTNDVQALDSLVTDGVVTLFSEHADPRRGGRDHARARRRSWRWSPSSPSPCCWSAASSSGSPRPAPTG